MADYFRHPTAIVETDNVGPGTRIWAFAHALTGAVIGRNCNIGDHCYIEGGVVIGDNVTIKNGVALWEGVTIEENAFIGPAAVFTNDLYPRSPRLEAVAAQYQGKGWLQPTVIGRGATVGAGAVILCGVTIGEYALLGAGAVVLKDVPPFTLAVGNPARPKGYVCRCARPVKFTRRWAECSACGCRLERRRGEVLIVL